MAATQADLDFLNRLKWSGTLSSRAPDGRMVTYRSMDEIDRAINSVQAELDAAGGVTRVKQVRISPQWGF